MRNLSRGMVHVHKHIRKRERATCVNALYSSSRRRAAAKRLLERREAWPDADAAVSIDSHLWLLLLLLLLRRRRRLLLLLLTGQRLLPSLGLGHHRLRLLGLPCGAAPERRRPRFARLLLLLRGGGRRRCPCRRRRGTGPRR